MIFDTHTHLNDDCFVGHEKEEVELAHEYGVDEMAVVGYDDKSNDRSVALSQQFDEVYSIIGWHPTEISRYTLDMEKKLEAQLAQSKVVALGEIGLDYYWMNDPQEEQEKVLRRQLAIARNMHLPVSIHTRSKEIGDDEAYQDIYRILQEEKVTGIIHSFNGNIEWMKKFVDLGMKVSFSGVVTFKKSTDVQEAAKAVPADAFLLETDAPYLAPVPKRGKTNHAAYTRYIAEYIAAIREVSLEEVARQTTQNAHQLFRIGEEASWKN